MASLYIQASSIIRNTEHFISLALQNDVSLTAVTKFCLSNATIVQNLINTGITSIADSNMTNFKNVKTLKKLHLGKNLRTTLIKTRVSDIEKITNLPLDFCPDRVFTSDSIILDEIRKLVPERRMEIVLIVEVGDMKEGIEPQDILPLVREYSDLSIIGVSANFSCMSGKRPDLESITLLSSIAQKIMIEKNLEKPFVSVGGTVIYNLLKNGSLKGLVSEIRIGEGIFFGYDSSSGCAIPQLIDSAFTLKGEIIEVKAKKIVLPENKCYNSFGENGVSRKTGKRICAVLDFGVLGCSSSHFYILETGMEIAGQTFDYTVVDITDCSKRYKTGEYIDFRIFYTGASQAFLNPYVEKIIENNEERIITT